MQILRRLTNYNLANLRGQTITYDGHSTYCKGTTQYFSFFDVLLCEIDHAKSTAIIYHGTDAGSKLRNNRASKSAYWYKFACISRGLEVKELF